MGHAAVQVLRGVRVGDALLAGLDRDRAAARARGVREVLLARKVTLAIQNHRLELTLGELGLKVNEATQLERVLREGRTGSWPRQFAWWLGRLLGPAPVALEAGIAEADRAETIPGDEFFARLRRYG